MVTQLIMHGTAVSVGTPLHTAVAYGHPDSAQFLLEYGADVHAQDTEGRTPLFFAAMYGHDDVVQVLLGHGAKKDIQDQEGKRAIDAAILANEAEPLLRFEAIRAVLTNGQSDQ